jgi:hypothetical protein
VRIYRAKLIDPETRERKESLAERNFCGLCGSALWLWHPRWPDLVHPFASAIDTDLPIPPEQTHFMLGSKAGWVQPHAQPQDQCKENYPSESLAAWHERLGLVE